MEKVGRNDPCPCGSGKKFKKCCEAKESRKKFHAEVLSSGADTTHAKKIHSFFKRSVVPVSPGKTESTEEKSSPSET